MFTVGIQNKHTGVTFYLKLADTATFDDLAMQISTVISADPSSFSIGWNGKRMDEGYRRVHEMFSMSNQDGKECIFVLVAPARGGGRGDKRKEPESSAQRYPHEHSGYDKAQEIIEHECELDCRLNSMRVPVDTSALDRVTDKIAELRKFAEANPQTAFHNVIKHFDRGILRDLISRLRSRDKEKKLAGLARVIFSEELAVISRLNVKFNVAQSAMQTFTALMFTHQHVTRFGFCDWAGCEKAIEDLADQKVTQAAPQQLHREALVPASGSYGPPPPYRMTE